MSDALSRTADQVNAQEVRSAANVAREAKHESAAADVTTQSSAYPPVEPESYRSINGWAIAGFILAWFSIFCWMESPPLFPPRAWWIPGLLVSAWGWWKIRQAPQVFAGMTLARLGLAVSLINGLGAITAQEVTYWVVRAEALRFAQEILDYVHQQKERELFLTTLEPETRRYKEPPADRPRLVQYFESQSRLGNPVLGFENSPLGQVMLKHAPNRHHWEYRGVTAYEVLSDISRPGYRFRLLYRVRSDVEGDNDNAAVYDVELSLVCQRLSDTRSRWKKRREWFLENWPQSVRLVQLPAAQP
ncbi:MAG: hypothetical protein RMJ19_05360 [Gemmatales bacterium]|nr:hypothetical protein [Gemmatales bacterium]MDW8175081.1 hypothetical protein [Gemmatales bacterium]